MQRVRIGLTGLAFVFLAVLLAAVFIRPAVEEAPITPTGVAGQRAGIAPAPAAPAADPHTEPLAELGVAPGNPETNEAAAPATQPARSPAGPPPAGR